LAASGGAVGAGGVDSRLVAVSLVRELGGVRSHAWLSNISAPITSALARSSMVNAISPHPILIPACLTFSGSA
jgi:hypothetical protein